MMKGITLDIEIKKVLCYSITVPTMIYASEKWTWNEGQRSRIHAVKVKMSYMRGACGVNRMDGESN